MAARTKKAAVVAATPGRKHAVWSISIGPKSSQHTSADVLHIGTVDYDPNAEVKADLRSRILQRGTAIMNHSSKVNGTGRRKGSATVLSEAIRARADKELDSGVEPAEQYLVHAEGFETAEEANTACAALVADHTTYPAVTTKGGAAAPAAKARKARETKKAEVKVFDNGAFSGSGTAISRYIANRAPKPESTFVAA